MKKIHKATYDYQVCGKKHFSTVTWEKEMEDHLGTEAMKKHIKIMLTARAIETFNMLHPDVYFDIKRLTFGDETLESASRGYGAAK